jgi:hypothetical protein
MAKKKKRKPYSQRSEIEKIRSQWRKIKGLHNEKQASAAVMRAATAAELAANFAIRKEFSSRSQFDAVFVDKLLRWANGLDGKMSRLIMPLFESKAERDVIRSLKAVADRINRERNGIAHQGEFRTGQEARIIIEEARHFTETLVRIYRPNFGLSQIKKST